NLYRREWDDFRVATVHGDKEVQRALTGSTYSRESWTQLLDDRFLRDGAFFIKHGEFDWQNDIGKRYVPVREVSEHPEAWNPDDEVFVPLYGPGEELLGILSLGDPASGLRPSDEEFGLLVGLAHYAAQALAAAQAAIVRERYRAALEELMHVSSGLTQTLSTDSILQSVCNGISNALGFQKVCVDLLADDAVRLATRAAGGDHRRHLGRRARGPFAAERGTAASATDLRQPGGERTDARDPVRPDALSRRPRSSDPAPEPPRVHAGAEPRRGRGDRHR